MEFDMPSIYCSPEKFGLVEVDEVDDAGSWDFNTLVLWKHIKTGKLYYAHDSGCSCPAPFEDYHSLSDATELTSATWDEFEKLAMSYDLGGDEKIQFVAKARDLIKKSAPAPESKEKAK